MKQIVIIIISSLLFSCNSVNSINDQNPTLPIINEGSAVIWFLGHCGFAVQTENYLLIFDYVEEHLRNIYPAPTVKSLDSGYINPDEIKNMKVCVFVTHQHSDHYDPIIFSWENTINDIDYFFGWQAAEAAHYNYLIGPRAEYTEENLIIYTINSYHSGVQEIAYLILVDGLTIYFNGDYQGSYLEDLQYLNTKTEYLDLAFVSPVWDERWDYFRINTEIINRFQPRAFFPMHVRVGDEDNYFPQFEQVYQPLLTNGHVVITNNTKGISFTYNSGTIE